MTWKYVPLSGKLPLIAVLQGIYKENADSVKTTKIVWIGKKGTYLYIILLLLMTLISLSLLTRMVPLTV